VLQIIKKWLGKNKEKKSAIKDVQTAPLNEDQLSSVSINPIVHNPPQIVVGCAQSNGLQRDQNEDSIYFFNSLISDENSQLPFGLYIIADGMGGHLHGEIASSSAVRALASFITRRMLPSLIGLEAEPQSDSLQEIMENGFRESQQAVLRKAPGGGTTLTAALLLGDQVTLAHVGDSRAYFLYPDGRIQAMTLDHSLVRRYVDLGRLTEEQARTDPQKNVLYRALGQLEPFRPDIVSHMMPHPGYLMLCTDGLWGVVPDMEIFKIIASAATPSDACQKLIEAANAAGGPDNISVIVVQYLN
jgi:serine/threonine protein phosphatase PrpC